MPAPHWSTSENMLIQMDHLQGEPRLEHPEQIPNPSQSCLIRRCNIHYHTKKQMNLKKGQIYKESPYGKGQHLN
jgi:hypothetical protein